MRSFVASILAMLAVVALVAPVSIRAAEPPNPTYSPAPPGSVAQSQLVYLAGDGMSSQWRGIASKKTVGTSAQGQAFYQWYLSIYAIDGATYHLQYRSPGNGGPLSTVTQAHGAQLWFPVQTLSIVGAAELMQPAVQQLVVESHEASADCGSSTVTVFATKGGKVVPAVSVRNGCDLTAKIVTVAGHAAIELSGPYYAANAALCCPTKPKATATLQYRNGAWSESPKLFDLYIGALPPN
jgi:hypothetical protein